MFRRKKLGAFGEKKERHIFFVLAIFFLLGFWLVTEKAHAVINAQINYQGKLTNASGVTVSDGSYDIKIVIYDKATGGICQYTLKGTCGTPTAASTTVTSGLFSINLGDTAAGVNALSSSLFNTSTLYLGVTVGSDSEMTPRKRIIAAPYAFTSLNLGGASSTIFVGTSTLPSNLVSYIENPTTASASNKILVIRGNSSQSGHLMDLQNSSGASLAFINSGGGIRTSSTLLVTGDTTFYATSSVRQLNTVRYADQFCSTPGTLDETCIQRAINDCPANGCEVFVPAGTYNFGNNPVVLKSGVRVRGAGKGNTIINMITGHTGLLAGSVAFRATGTVDVATTLSAAVNATSKTRSVIVTSASGLAVGNRIWLQGDASTTSSAKQQMSTIAAISGSTITLTDTVLFSYHGNTSSTFQKITPITNVAISDLTIQTSQTSARAGILVTIADTVLIERVEIKNTLHGVVVGTSGVSSSAPNTNITIRNSEFTDQVNTSQDNARPLYLFGDHLQILDNRIKGIIGKGIEVDALSYALIAHNTFLDATTTVNTFGITINDSAVRSRLVNNSFSGNLTFGIHGSNDVNNNPIAVQDNEISNNIFGQEGAADTPIQMTSTIDFQRNIVSNNVIKANGLINGIALFACTVRDNIIQSNYIGGAGTAINIGFDGAACGASPLPPTTTKRGNYVANNLMVAPTAKTVDLSGPGNKIVNNSVVSQDFVFSRIEVPNGATAGYIFDTASSTPTATSTVLLSIRNADNEKFTINAGGAISVLQNATSSLVGGLTLGTSGGFLGVGTASPEDKLEVESTGNMGIRIDNTGNGSTDFSALRFFQSSGAKGVIYTNQENMFIQRQGTGILVLNGDGGGGNVGINQTFASYLVDASGDLRLRGGNRSLYITNGTTSSTLDYQSLTLGSNETTFRQGRFFADSSGNVSASGTLLVRGGSATSGLLIHATISTTTLTSLVSDGAGTGAFVINTSSTIASSTAGTPLDRVLLAVQNNGTNKFLVSGGGNVYATAGFNANSTQYGIGDFAENVNLTPGEKAEPGDVLVIDTTNPSKFKKSTTAHAREVAGVVSDTGAFVIGSGGADRAAMALAGLVKVKATAANGAIKPGDYLVTSNIPGAAMRYDSSTASIVGLIGQALEPLEGGEGKIIVLINRGLAPAQTVTDAPNLHVQSDDSGRLILNQDLDMNGQAILNVKVISGFDNKWRLDEDGYLVAVVKTAHGDKELYTLQNVNAKEVLLSGIANLNNGRAEIVFEPIDQEIIDATAPLKVTVTLRESANGLYVSGSSAQGFMVRELDNGSSNASFSWLVIAKRKAVVSLEPAVSTPPASSTPSLSAESVDGVRSTSSTPPDSDAASSSTLSVISAEAGIQNQ